MCNNFVTDLHEVRLHSFSLSQLEGTATGTRSARRCFVRVPRHVLVSTGLFVLWLSADSFAQNVSFLQDDCNPETAGSALGAASVGRRLVLGGVTVLTNEAGCMVEHHLRPAKLIRSVLRSGRTLAD